MHLSRRRGRLTEQQASIRKFQDRSKESIKRLKALKFGLEKSPPSEVKEFYSEHNNDVFYVVYGSFTTLETSIQDKLSKGKPVNDLLVKELTELVLPQVLSVLTLLPELVHQKWQFNSIYLIIRKLLHPGNHIKLRQYGVQLLVVWVEALQENAGDPCMELFASVVPHFPPQKTPMGLPLAVPASGGLSSGGLSSGGLGDRYGVYSTANLSRGVGTWGVECNQGHLHRSSSVILLGSSGSPSNREVVCSNILLPLVPPHPQDPSGGCVTEQLMQCLLDGLTDYTGQLHWDQPDRHLRGVAHLFFLFKLFYLACLYKDFREEAALYSPPSPPSIDLSTAGEASSDGLDSLMEETSDGVGHTTPSGMGASSSPIYHRKRGDPYRMSAVIKLEYDISNPIYTKVKNLVVISVLRWFVPDGKKQLKDFGVETASLSFPLAPLTHHTPSGVELIRQTWLASRDNISLLLEICRQGFTTLTHPQHRRLLVDLYRHWNQPSEKPSFMCAPPTPPAVRREGGGEVATPLTVQCWEQLSDYRGFQMECVEAGEAAGLAMVIAHTQQVFILGPGSDYKLQEELCQKVIRLHLEIARSWMLDKCSWEYLLSVLLHHTWKLLTHKDRTLGHALATPLIKMLLFCFLRMSMVVPDVNLALWEALMQLMHSLTHWKEVIEQWKVAMTSMTEVLTQAVYGLKLNALPLEQLASGRSTTTHNVNVGRRQQPPMSRYDFLSFNLFDCPPSRPPKSQHVAGMPSSRDQVDGSPASSSTRSARNILTHSATVEEKGNDFETEVSQTKRHSAPHVIPASSRPGRTSIRPLVMPDTIAETSIDGQEEAYPSPPSAASLNTPYRPLQEDDSSSVTSSHTNDGGGAVIANVNARSPTSSQEDEDGSGQDMAVRGVAGPQSKGLRKPLLKHHSLESKSKKGCGLDGGHEEGGKQRKRRKWFGIHKRSDSVDGSTRIVVSDGSDGESCSRESEVGVATEHCLQPFILHKSSSEGNLHAIFHHGSHTFPRTGNTQPDLLDSSEILPLPPVSTAAIMTHDLPSQPAPVLATSTSVIINKSRPLRRSLTIDSPEPIIGAGGEAVPQAAVVPTACGCDSGEWSPKVAALVWLRMLKVMGNVNDIHDPLSHANAMTGLYDIWSALRRIQDNSGISMDRQTTPPLPEFMPPLDLFLPWVLEACTLPNTYASGRDTAYKLLCQIMIVHWHSPPSLSHLAHFYHLMHLALQPSSDTCAVAIKYGYQLFSHGLTGASVLLPGCVSACGAILANPNSTTSHNEALYMLGSLLHLPDHTHSGMCDEELKERIVEILFTAAVKETSRISRCIALYLVGTLVFSDLYNGAPCRRLPEGVDILLASLQFSDRGVAMCAIDMLSLLSEVGTQMTSLYPSMLFTVIQAICYAIAVFLMEDLNQASWVDKVLVTLLLLLRDWLMLLPLSSPSPSPSTHTQTATIRTVFEVLQAAAGSQEHRTVKQRHALSQLFTIHTPVNIELHPLTTSTKSNTHTKTPCTATKEPGRKDVLLSSDKIRNSSHRMTEDGLVQTAARSVLTHLLNFLGHFPFGCGAAQLSSNVKEHHDCPSLYHLDDMSAEVFDSPRMQFFALDNTAVVTLVEVPTMVEGVPGEASSGPYQARIIVRDVTGKYAWDSTLLYGPDSTEREDCCSLLSAESLDSLVESVGYSSEGTGGSDFPPPHSDLSLHPPSWRTHANSDRDVLQDLLEHVQLTSPECVSDDSSQHLLQSMPTLCEGEESQGVEGALLKLLNQQQNSEQSYVQEVGSQPCMRGEQAHSPPHFPHTPAFHHCCVFLSHLGLLSWDKRNHLNLLKKTNQLILELKNLDLLPAQSRATYKVAVLYVAPGQEDKASILNNSGGSKSYEEFVAGLGWEVNMATHAGYMAGMQKEFASCSMPYYATSSEEVLFHVATRMTSPRMEQKVRHLGNDEVHIVWSEHWRDYRRSIFKTQFADVLIVLNPLSNGLIRVHINKKPNVPQFGPLYDGALVDRLTVAPLVRATAINGLKAQRTPLIGYRGRYEERLKYIQTITSNQLYSTYEDFCENVMHPLEMSASHTTNTTTSRNSPHKPVVTEWPSGSVTNLLRSFALSSTHVNSSTSQLIPPHIDHTPRQRSNTNDDRMMHSSDPDRFGPQLYASVPDSLNTLNVSEPSHMNTPPEGRGLVFHGITSPSSST